MNPDLRIGIRNALLITGIAVLIIVAVALCCHTARASDHCAGVTTCVEMSDCGYAVLGTVDSNDEDPAVRAYCAEHPNRLLTQGLLRPKPFMSDFWLHFSVDLALKGGETIPQSNWIVPEGNEVVVTMARDSRILRNDASARLSSTGNSYVILASYPGGWTWSDVDHMIVRLH